MNIVGKYGGRSIWLYSGLIAMMVFSSFQAIGQVNGVVASQALIIEADMGSSFTITVTYDQIMDPTPVPSIAFDGGADYSGTLTNEMTSWSDTQTLVYTYTIADGTEEYADIDVTISGGQETVSMSAPANYTENDLFSIDNARPDPTITSNRTSPTGSTDIEIRIDWDEDVIGFTAADIDVTNATKVSALSGSGNGTYKIDITPTGGEVVISVDIAANAGSITDLAGNGNNAATTYMLTHDSVEPTVGISSTELNPTNASPIPINILFSEPVTGFTNGDIDVSGGAKSSFSGSGASYSVQITPSSSEQTITVDIDAGSATDGVNDNTAATQFTIYHDSKKPSVTISSSEPNPTTNSPITLDIDFDEDVTGLTAGEVNVTGGTKGTLMGSGQNYTIDVTPSSTEVTINASIPAGAATDGLNTSNASNSFVIVHDSEPPTILSLAYVDDTHVQVTFSEDVDESKSESASYTFDNGISEQGAGAVWQGPGANADKVLIQVDNLRTANLLEGGTILTVTISGVEDETGNVIAPGSMQTGALPDLVDPEISNITFSETIITENILAQLVTVLFNEPMQTSVPPTISLNGSDWTLDNSSGGLGWTDNQTFKAEFTHGILEEDFTANVSVATDEVQDVAGNGNVASSTYNFFVDTDKPAADITYSDPDGYVRQGEIMTITADFDEDMGSTPSIELTGANAVGPVSMTPDATFPLTKFHYAHNVGSGDGTVTVAFSVGTDLAGNVTKAAPTSGATFEVDNMAPILFSYTPVTSTFPESNNLPLNQQFTVVFDEPVLGAGTDNINVKEVGGIDNLLSGSVVHTTTNATVNFTPTLVAQKEYEILLEAGSFVDRAGNAFAGNGATPWNDLTSFGAPTIDPITAPSLCIDVPVMITGKFLTGVTKITFLGGAGADADVVTFTIDNDNQITLTVPLLALPGQIDFIKENGLVNPAMAPANDGDANALSNSVFVGPRQADIIVDPGGVGNVVCSEGVTNTGIQFTIQGGTAPYMVTYTESGVLQPTISYTPGQIIDVNPPNDGANVYVLTEVTDLNSCNVPVAQLGSVTITEVETTHITISSTTSPQNPVCLATVGGIIDLTGTVTGLNKNVSWTSTNGTGNFTNVDNAGPTIAARYNFTPQDYALDILTIRVTSVGSTAPCSEEFQEIDITFTLNRSVDLGDDIDLCFDSGGTNETLLSGVLGGDANAGTWAAVSFPGDPFVGGDGLWVLNGGAAGPNPGLINDNADGMLDGKMEIVYQLSTNDIQNGRVSIELAPSGGTCGAPTTGKVDVFISVLPAPTVISQSDTDFNGNPDHEICSGDGTVLYEVNNPSASNFTWLIIDAPDGTTGQIVSGQTTSKIFVDWGETVTSGVQLAQVQIIENNQNNCDSDPVFIDVFINPRPDVTFNPIVTNFSLAAAPAQLVGDPIPDKTTTFGIFTGTGVVKDANDDYFFNPAIAGTSAPHAITYTYTDVKGCTNSSIPVDFTVFDASDAIIATATGLAIEEAYCADAPSLEIELSTSFLIAQLSSGFEFSRFAGPGITDQGNQQTAILEPSAPFELTLGGIIEIEYFQIQSISPFTETSLGTQSVVINPVPVPSPTDYSNGSFCTDDDLIPLTRNFVLNPTTDPGATFTFEIVGGDTDGLIENPSLEQYFLNPANAQFAADDFTAKVIEIRYYYINGNGCDDEFFMPNIRLYQQPPAPAVSNTDICFTEEGTNTLSVLDAVLDADIIWYSDSLLTNVLQRSTSPIFEVPEDQANVEDYYVTQEINDCESPRTKITVGKIPAFEFEGICAGTATEFDVLGDLTGINDLIWTITDDQGQVISSVTETSSLASYSYTFTDPGLYEVSLGSSICPNPKNLKIFIVPSVTVTTEYLEDFEGNNGWVPWGSDTPISSWENAVPNGIVINSGSKSWITNADGAFPSNENSFVYSPCFDISVLSRPMISFDIFNDMGNGGVVFQYSADGRFGTWITIGQDNAGINWYDQRNIPLEEIPGGVGTNPFGFGWTGLNSGWRNARYPLDEIPVEDRGSVIFRISFNSGNNSDQEGFAFDNFRISEKYRLVVLEHFENTTNNSQIDFIEEEGVPNSEMICIQYRADSEDDLFVSEVNSRLEYYGFTSAPSAIFDGSETQSDSLKNWFVPTFTFQSLVEPLVDIATTANASTSSTLHVQTSIQAREDITAPFLVQIAVVEKDANGLKNVIRKFLPSASGTKYSSLTVSDGTVTVDEEWLISTLGPDELDLGIVVFVQDEQTKDVLQASYLDVTANAVTGIEFADEFQLTVYPNPVDHLLTVDFEQKEVSSVKVFNQFGQLLLNEQVQRYSNNLQVDTSPFASGVYFVQVENKDVILDRVKFIVSH